jgi:hypothetical protein
MTAFPFLFSSSGFGSLEAIHYTGKPPAAKQQSSKAAKQQSSKAANSQGR